MTVRGDVDARVSVTTALAPQTIASSTTTSSAAIDTTALQPGDRFLVVVSVGSRTDGNYTFKIQDATTSGGSYSDAALFSGSFSAISAANTTQTATFIAATGRPFFKVVCTSAGVTSGASVSAHVVAMDPALV